MGWTWVRMIARFGDVHVITRSNNRPAIERHVSEMPAGSNVTFVYVDLPPLIMRFKRGQRGIRAYYLVWQLAAARRALRLHEAHKFDVVWHLTLANAWLGSGAALLPMPLIYGPVGGGVAAPWRLAGVLGVRGTLYEIIRATARTIARYANPLARASWARARILLAQNEETRQWFPPRYQTVARVLSHAVVLPAEPAWTQSVKGGDPTALFAGRLIAWKGGELALRAIAEAPRWRLILCGDGPDRERLERLAKRLGVAGRVEFRGHVTPAEVAGCMASVDVLLHPSLHDDAPLVVTEALANGLPVVCLKRGGPPALSGNPELAADLDGDAAAIATQLAERLELALQPQAKAFAKQRAAQLSLEQRASVVREILASFGEPNARIEGNSR